MTWIDDVKAQVDLLTVAQRYTTLRATGASWRGPCPVHGGKGANFAVYPEKGSYYCFTCGANGDVFTLLEKLHGLDFLEAAERLAGELGIPVVRGQRRDAERESPGQARVDLQRRFVSEGLAWWGPFVSDSAIRAWGLGARRAGDTVVGTVPLFAPGGRRPIGWMCYAEGENGTVTRLGLAPESDPFAVDGVTWAGDVAAGLATSGVLGVLCDPFEAVVAWEAGGRGVIGLTRAPSPDTVTLREDLVVWLTTLGVDGIFWGLGIREPEVRRTAFALEVPTVTAGFASLLPAGALAERVGHDLARGMGEALDRWEAALADRHGALAVDSLQWRVELLRRRGRSGVVPMELLQTKVGPTLRAASRLADRRLFYAYSRWVFRESGHGNFARFLGDITRTVVAP